MVCYFWLVFFSPDHPIRAVLQCLLNVQCAAEVYSPVYEIVFLIIYN